MRHGLVVVVGAALAGRAAPAAAQAREVARSSPIVATVGGVEAQYQGTLEVAKPEPPVTTFVDAGSAATFEFPYARGHLRAVRTADLGSGEERFEDLAGVALFDAAAPGGIPPVHAGGCASPFSATCRTVFTTIEAPEAATGLALRPDRVFLNTSPTTVAQLAPLLARDSTLDDASVAILIERLLAGVRTAPQTYEARLGGIDRSTLAIVEPTSFVRSPTGEERPTMIYVGALDGMVHAICAEAGGPCQAAGQELWAFIPRTQLGALRFNAQRIDGSMRVADVFDDFDLADGQVVRQFRTVLTFQTGSGDPATADRQPSILAIDVSDPADPIVLWERSTPAERAAVDLGVGLGLAMGPARVAGEIRNLTFAQTRSGGTSPSAGFVLAAIDTATGAEVWSFRHTYPAPRSGGSPPVPATGIPGGPAIFDLEHSAMATHVAVGSLYGDLWILEADGEQPYGEAEPPGAPLPVFRFSTDFHPIGASPTIYLDQATGRLHAVAVSGGYADPTEATWVRPLDDQFAVSVVVDPAPGNVPIDETPGDGGDDRAFVIDIGTGRRITAPAIVAGNELFLTADKTDINLTAYGTVSNTGSLTRYSLTGEQKGSLLTIAGGGSAVAVTDGGVAHVGSGAGAMKLDVNTAGGGGAFDAAGRAVERHHGDNSARLLWLNGLWREEGDAEEAE